ncbi:MAG: response regulator [Anaerolinea sp.]|nr:response regulator [Anaerolinea sp.]
MNQIVIIEDNADSARLASRILQREGMEVLVADEGELGLQIVFGSHPNLILVDLGLPDIDGQTVVVMLRQHPELSTVPIIAFTAWPESTAHEMAKAYGCDGIITKPIDTRRFGEQIKAFLAPDFRSP